MLVDQLGVFESIFGIDLDELFEAELAEHDIGRGPVDGILVLLEGMVGVMLFMMMPMVMLAEGAVLVLALPFSQLEFTSVVRL